MIRVLVADDHPIFRQGVRQILAETIDLTVTGEAATSEETLARVRSQPCDVVLLDLSMPGRGGLEVLRDLRREYPALRILVLSMHSEEQFAIRTVQAGADGYLTKDAAPGELVAVIRKLVAGGKHVSARVAEQLVQALGGNPSRTPHERLSQREFQVLRALAAGRSVGQIADEFALSVKTVSTYRTRLLEKMAMKTNAELIAYAIRHQLVV